MSQRADPASGHASGPAAPAAPAGAAPAGAVWPRRVAVVAEKLPFASLAGKNESLFNLVAMLRAIGAELHLVCLREIRPPRKRFRMLPRYLAPFASAAIPGTLRLGADFYVLRPDLWFGGPGGGSGGGSGGAVWTFDRLSEARLRTGARALARLKPDLVIADYFNAADIFALLDAAIPKAIFTHDLLELRAVSARAAGLPLDFDPALIAWEREAIGRADLCIVHKAEEAAHVEAINPRCFGVAAPFSIDPPEIDPDPDRGPDRAPVALFVGTVNRPNVDGLRWLLEEVWPRVARARPDARLRVAGAVAATASDWPAGATPLGFVEDLAGEYRAAAVALTPLRFGSGLKIKLVEALAHGVPSVATTAGADGVAPAPEAALRVADDAAGFAAAILAAFAEPDAGAARRAARAVAVERFSRAAAARRLGDALARFGAAGGR